MTSTAFWPPADDLADRTEARRRWLSVLAQAPRAELAAYARPMLADLHFEPMRPPETGLLMLRGRIGNSGDRFNLGEATVTRCALRLVYGAQRSVGIGCILGRDEARAHWVAGLDAMLQIDVLHDEVRLTVIEPLALAVQAARHHEAARNARSRVKFYAVQPEAPQ